MNTTLDIKRTATDAIENPERFTLGSADFAVGTILPYYPPGEIELPEGWLLCAGQKVTDSSSPIFGFNVPQLADQRFLLGTCAGESFGAYGGANNVLPSQMHNHGGSTGGGPGSRGADNGLDWQATHGRHSHTIEDDNAHNHGGDARPQHFGVLFLIKIK
ncbi:MAG: hypothetical protein Aurels2KO_25570 [Aureliella sp.]